MQSRPDNEATFIKHTSCDVCGSSDANGVYDDGNGQHIRTVSPVKPINPIAKQMAQNRRQFQTKTKPSKKSLLKGEPKALSARGLTEADCAKFSYWVGQNAHGELVQIANYRDSSGAVVAQKVQGKDKSFQFIGDTSSATLFGSHLWSKGKKLCLTEGEIDAISLSSCFQHKYAVCSIPTGASGAVRAVKRNFDYINAFDEVVICFDMDEAGQQAAQAVAEVLPVGKAKIARLPAKDANEAIIQGQRSELVQAVWQAKEFRPDGIKSAKDYRDIITVDEAASAITWPYSQLNEVLRGLHRETLTTICEMVNLVRQHSAKELIHHLLMHEQRVGVIALEESNKGHCWGLSEYICPRTCL